MTDTQDLPLTQEDDLAYGQMAAAIRALSIDAIEKAQSGHPGMPLGMADVATVLYRNHIKFDPSWPEWPGRDRFVLSAGHGSMLLYSLLHLTGYARPTMDDIKNFRQMHSPTAGHPEYGECVGIETTTGPLGQGLATAVGMAIAQKKAAQDFGGALFDHHTYVIAGDGCLMEGVSQEAITLAGHLKLAGLIVLWDDNSICIDGDVGLATSEDMIMRFEAAGWHVQRVDGHDAESVDAAIEEAKTSDQPSIIACRTTIGYGAPTKAGTASSHGSPLGESEIAGVREVIGWPHAPFEVPDDVYALWHAAAKRGAEGVPAWKAAFAALPASTQADITRRLSGDLPASFKAEMEAYISGLQAEPVKVATRKASQMALEVANKLVPETVGGSADLTGSNLTKTSGMTPIAPDDFSGRYMHYGIREFGMAAAMNGMALYGTMLPYGGTFMVFTDYARPAMRLSALMKQRVAYVMTHDSIGLGEDGPTHQPIEHLASLRAMPGITVFRPADAVETAECWALALENKGGPSVLSLSRQAIKQSRTVERCGAWSGNKSALGGYTLDDKGGVPEVVIMASGTEVEIAIDAAEQLRAAGRVVRVVSMVSTELFDQQDAAYKEDVLPKASLKVSIEAGSTYGWHRYVADGIAIGIDTFGASAPAEDLYEHFGITAKNIVEQVTARLA